MTIDEYKKEVKQIRPQMLLIAQSYLRDNDEAEDVVQDVLLKLWQLLDTLRLPMSPLALVLVKNRCIDVLRRHRYMVEVKDSIVDEQQRDDDRYEAVIAIIDSLPTMQQTIMRLRHMEGMEISDIAKLTDSKEATVRKALSRARQAIKTQFLKLNSNE
jgi:RNA polymerase sigma factor, sigma-70 family